MLERDQEMGIFFSLFTAIKPSAGTGNMHQEFGYWLIIGSLKIRHFEPKSKSVGDKFLLSIRSLSRY